MKKLDIIVQTEGRGIKIPDRYREAFSQLLDFCVKKRGGYMRVVLSPPFKKRTTGEKSQNHAINGFIRQIANETGEDFDVIKSYAKRKAIKRGYPTYVNVFGEAIPKSETEIDTFEAGYLIEAIHELAAFLGMTLQED